MKRLPVAFLFSLLSALATIVHAQDTVIRINAAKDTCKVSPILYGLMTEEINHSYDGGLYAEVIRNRIFKDDVRVPAYWSVVSGSATLALDETQPLNSALPVSLKVDASALGTGQRGSVANDGYWGVPVHSETEYRASFYARPSGGFTGPLTIGIVSNDGKTVYAQSKIPALTAGWNKYTATLTTGKVVPTKDARFVISTDAPGIFHLALVSLMPPTYKDRTNGNRSDLIEKLVAMKPSFLRFPGGNYLEGNKISERFDWKKTLGSLENRPGHLCPWNYRSSDGLGLLEFLEWADDMHAEPLLAVFAGLALKEPAVHAGPELQPFVQDALDEIEYITGDKSTIWGARRAADGHPEPFKLTYVEIGNEDQVDKSHSYDARFAQFYDAIKAKYPKLQLIATIPVKSRTPDVLDIHSYFYTAERAARGAHRFDRHPKSEKVLVGEWGTWEGSPTSNLNAALGDAAFMTGMERNSDAIIMSCFAPIFVNVSDEGCKKFFWNANLIGYDALTSYSSPTYYAQKMFSNHLGDVVPESSISGVPSGIPTFVPIDLKRRPNTPQPDPKPIDELYYSVTKSTAKGLLYLKIVNISGAPHPIRIEISGIPALADTADCIVLASAKSTDTNTITEPVKVVPTATTLPGVAPSFTYTSPAYSVTVLTLAPR